MKEKKEKKEKKVIYISSMGGHLKELLALKKSMKKENLKKIIKMMKMNPFLKRYITFHMEQRKI